ncbi:glycosyltransferase family 4 protein [Pedobacter hartonius]|nr:glycosyltransferase family 4 protein [Pedobacter hartonius]
MKLAFRGSKVYKKGMISDYRDIDSDRLLSLPLLSNETLFYQINCLNISPLFKAALKVPFFLLEKLKLYTIWNLIIFSFMLKKESPAIVHINNGGYPAARSCNVLVLANYLFGNAKLIYQVNNQASLPKRFDSIIDGFIERNVCLFITASNLAKQKLVELRKFDVGKIKVINNCVIPASIGFSKAQICEELNLSKDAFIITQVAFLTKRKGQAKLINAIHLLFTKHTHLKEYITLILIGNGEDEKELKELVHLLELTNHIFFLGYRQNSQDYIAASDLFILPSISNEDMPLVLLTALQLGKPIISSNFAGISQVIQTEENGLLIDLNEETFENDLYEDIYRLYNDKALRTKIGLSAEKSFDAYTPGKYGENLEAIYSGLLEK